MNETINRIKDRLYTNLESKLGHRVTRQSGAVITSLIDTYAVLLSNLYHQQQEAIKQIFPRTATGKWLEMHCAMRGITRDPGVKASGYMTVRHSRGDVKLPRDLEIHTIRQFEGNPLSYVVKEKIKLTNDNEKEKISRFLVEANSVGTKYNLSIPKGEREKLNVPIPGVLNAYFDSNWTVENPEAKVPKHRPLGRDEESDQQLLSRYIAAWHILLGYSNARVIEKRIQVLPNILGVWIDDMHPNGQGSLAIYVLTKDGSKIEKSKKLEQEIRGAIKDLAVLGSFITIHDLPIIHVSVELGNIVIREEAGLKKESIIANLENEVRKLFFPGVGGSYQLVPNKPLYRNTLIHKLMDVKGVVNIGLIKPDRDILTGSKNKFPGTILMLDKGFKIDKSKIRMIQ